MNKIVLSGSMKFRNEIIDIKNKLTDIINAEVIIPRECIETDMSKKEASKLHFDEIINKETDAMLVINCNKENLENYIGANTLAEIAFGFYFNKKIYLLNNMYEPYKEELEAWGVIPLKGELDKLKEN